jgi:hypothetical protein
MKNLLLLLISTAITSFGIATIKSDRYLTSPLVGSLNEAAVAEVQETTSTVLFNCLFLSGSKISIDNDLMIKKESRASKKTLDFEIYGSDEKQITLINLNYKVNKLLLISAVV